jgi:hypothetical protein
MEMRLSFSRRALDTARARRFSARLLRRAEMGNEPSQNRSPEIIEPADAC